MSNYHSNFFEPGKSHRVDLDRRLKIISDELSTEKTLLDVGTSGGYYSFGLREKFSSITAIDNVPELIDKCNDIKKKHNVANVEFFCSDIKEVLGGVDTWDCALYLSVHHHVVNLYGMKDASSILRELSERCDTIFFDMGQYDENCTKHPWWQKLPPNDNQEEWLYEYLSKNTTHDSIKRIGDTPIHGTKRILWKTTRL